MLQILTGYKALYLILGVKPELHTGQKLPAINILGILIRLADSGKYCVASKYYSNLG